MPDVKKLPLLGCPCIPLESEEDAILALTGFAELGCGGYTVAINAEKIAFHRSRLDVRGVIDAALLPYPDGFGAVIAFRTLHGMRAGKVDMPKAVMTGAARHGWKLFVLGAEEAVNREATQRIGEAYPGIQIVGRMNGYESEASMVEAIRAARPHVVMAALGSPRQELFAARLTAQVPSVLVVGCGGALDILSGRKVRAPAFMVKNGLEWLYRLWKEPGRWRRQLVLPLFATRLALAVMKMRVSRIGSSRNGSRNASG